MVKEISTDGNLGGVQQITAVSAAINGGFLNTPFVVKSISDDSSKSIIYENKTKLKRKVIKKN